MAVCKRGARLVDECVFCESDGDSSDIQLSLPSNVGKENILKLLPILRKNKSKRRLSDRLGALEDSESEVRYHKNCYRLFVRENDIQVPRETNVTQRPSREPVDLT